VEFDLKIDPKTGERYAAVHQKGKSLLNDPFMNKGSAFTQQEREMLNLHGLLPYHVSTMKDQVMRNYPQFTSCPTDLAKFSYLESLHDRNETLFYRFLHENIEEVLPIVYTPTVGEACQKFSHIYHRARGLYISYEEIDYLDRMFANFHCKNPSVIVVTDGERILGLGDQGADGMGIPIGKLCLYTLCGGISPYTTLPVMLDVGTDNEERRQDPLYLGMRRRRIRGKQYQNFVDRFVDAVKRSFPHVLLQWEDFLKANAIEQLQRFRDQLTTFNDDIQGTGSMVLASVYRVVQVTGRAMRDHRVLIAGAGAAAHGIAGLLVAAFQEEGLSLEAARKRIWMVDSKGLVTETRPNLEPFKATYARGVAEIGSYRCRDRAQITLEEAVVNAEPTILIGTSAVPGLFNRQIIEAMAGINERPAIFPLSNPTSRAECTPHDAIRWSRGRAIVATGSPFQDVVYNGRTYGIGLCNNAFIFPGIGLGVTAGHIRRVTDAMFIAAAKALASEVSGPGNNAQALSPDLHCVRGYAHSIACAVVRCAVAEGHADEDALHKLEEKVTSAMWFPEYLPYRYEQ